MDRSKEQSKVLAYENSEYFSRYLSYLVDLVFVISIVTIILVYIFNSPPIIYQLPFYYLYTHNSIHRLILDSYGIDFVIFYFIISFTYYAISSYFGRSLGNLILNLRIRNVSYIQNEGEISWWKRFILKLKYSSLRSIFLTIPLFPLVDNFLAKNGTKLTDNYLKTMVVHPLRLKKIKIRGPINDNSNHFIAKISHKIITYREFLEYFGLRESRDRPMRAFVDKMTNHTNERQKYIKHSNANMKRISLAINSKEFFLSGFLNSPEKDSITGQDSIWKVKRRYRFDYFYASGLLYFIPFIVAILIGWHVTNGQTFSVPAPLMANKFVPPEGLSQVQQSIFNQNFPIDLKFLILGGLTFFFLPYLGIYSSIYLPNLEIANVLHTKYWYYIFYSVFPQLFIECFGYVIGIMAGLYLSKLLVDTFVSYRMGVIINKFFNMVYYNLSKFGLMLILSIACLLVSSYVEAYGTSYILNHFYFIHR